MSADGLAAVGAGEEGAGARVGLDLVCLVGSGVRCLEWERRVLGLMVVMDTMRTQTLNSGRGGVSDAFHFPGEEEIVLALGHVC